MPVVIGDIETEVTVDGSAAPSGSTPAEPAPFEVQVEELRAVIRAVVAEEVERALRRRLPER